MRAERAGHCRTVSLALRVAAGALTRPQTRSFGDDFSQRAELHLPRRTREPLPVAVMLHGGYWQTRIGKLVCRPLAADLVRRGWAVWNLEYRRLGKGRGGGGGWPATFDDVASGIDFLAELGHPCLDLSRVAVVGHSAGGHLALWAANRSLLPSGEVGADPRVPVHAVAALSPVTDLARAGRPARALLGGEPDECPQRWEQADPIRSLPPPVPGVVVHPSGDETISLRLSKAYVQRCRDAGADVELRAPDGENHRHPIDPSSESWRAAVEWLDELRDVRWTPERSLADD
jgi:acetyl esterase/lipase